MKNLKSFTLFLVTAYAATARGALPPVQDLDEAVFSAKVVAIVSHQDGHSFKVERILNGALPIGTVIEIPSFKLVTWNPPRSQNERDGDPTPVAMTDSTRILMFLNPDEKNPRQYVVTEGGTAFFYRDVSKIDELDRLGSQACATYAIWLAACQEPDREKRVRELYPFAVKANRTCQNQTLAVLAQTSPEAGDYFAVQLQKAPPSEQGRLLYCVQKIHSAKLHAAVIAAIDTARRNVEEFHAKKHEGAMPADISVSAGVIDAGLLGLASFDDATDLPYFRGMTQFITDDQLTGGLDDCLRMMREHPSDQNVPLLLSVWDHYKTSLKLPGTPFFLTINLAAALGTQKDSAVVPTLVELLDDHDAHDTALSGLWKVTGKKFQSDAEWKEYLQAAH